MKNKGRPNGRHVSARRRRTRPFHLSPKSSRAARWSAESSAFCRTFVALQSRAGMYESMYEENRFSQALTRRRRIGIRGSDKARVNTRAARNCSARSAGVACSRLIYLTSVLERGRARSVRAQSSSRWARATFISIDGLVNLRSRIRTLGNRY